jgi:hypothetical protein
MLTIPEIDPEVVKAVADKMYGGDTEKVPTTTLNDILVRGVTLNSRYAKAAELNTMQMVVLELPQEMIDRIASIMCDSKASDTYEVKLRVWNKYAAKEIGKAMENILLLIRNGHNGIALTGTRDGEHVDIFADWNEPNDWNEADD